MFNIPDWAYEFHGHKCPFMPIGYRMGALALQRLGVPRCQDHEMRVFSEMGIGHPQTCMMDGLQAATGATFGKGMLEKLYYGKVAAIFWYAEKGAVRIALTNSFADKMAAYEFFKYRKQGVEPSKIPAAVSDEVIALVLNATDEELFKVTPLQDLQYTPVKGSFNKAKCEMCGEYVFERYLRRKDGKVVCIPCSGREPGEMVIHLPLK